MIPGPARDGRASRIAVAFARETARSADARLCRACVEVLSVAGAGITILGGQRSGLMCVSDERMAALEELQYTMGEGPCQDAYRSGRTVHAPRLGTETSAMWPTFVRSAHAAGVGAVFAYPMALHGAKIGVLTLYQDAEGELTSEQHADSMAVADVLAETVLSLQDDAPWNELAPSLEEAVAHRAEVHQATGMVAVQLGISPADALSRLRAHAFAHDRSLTDVAARIVRRTLQLEDDGSEGTHPNGGLDE